ncbi:XrtA/PEP-CTERM system TPR-repeat protein PrsT [Rhodopila globiformis]|nr:XrtA/PEP-CTERM system TPR-repeat protein PrsT [Rhodopila globiformis]
MRTRSLGWLMMGAWLGAYTLAPFGTAHAADYMAAARDSMKKGDIRAAQIDLRNAVRNDPQNAEAHYWLGRVDFELGDPVATQREAIAARDRGFDPHQAVPLLAQALLAQNQFQELLDTLKPGGKDPALDAAILVSRGYAEVGLKRPEDAQKSFAEAEQVAPNAVEPLLADARLAVARADLARAQAKIDRALEAEPKSVEARLAKAQLLRLKNDIPGAIAVLDALITDQPGVMQARLDRCSLELAAGKNDAARADLDVVLKTTPGNVQAIYLQAVMEAQARNYKAADADLERISPYVSRIQRAYYLLAIVKEQLGQLEQAEDAAQKYLGRSPNDLAAYKVLARIQFAKHRPDQAIDTLSKVAESGKGDPETYDLLGRAYAATGRAAEAVQAFSKARDLAPNDVGVQTRLASEYMRMGKVDAAMTDLEHTLTLAPKIPAVGEALFFAALATGDTSKASDALAKIRAAQGETDVVGNLEGLFKLAQLDIPGAQATFSGLVAKNPDFMPARINLARVLAMQGKVADAETLLTAVLAKHPAQQPILTMLASTYVQANRLPDAIALLERAHAAEPNQLRVTLSLGDLYIRAGKPQQALDLTLNAPGDNANATGIPMLRAAAYAALGQRTDARTAYAAILKQDPGNAVARRQLVGLLVQAGDYESARNVITNAMANSARNYQLYLDYVAIDLKATGLDAALASADQLQAQDQDFADARALKGDVYMMVNRPADAANAYAAAAKAAPSSLLTTREATALVKSGRADDAAKLLVAWLAKHPDDMTATKQASEVAISANRLDVAKTYLEQVLKTQPHDTVALNNLAWVLQHTGDMARAEALGRQAYILAPGAQTADTLGWIMVSAGDLRNGVMLLRQAATEAHGDPRIVYHYGVALKDSGDRDGAKKQFTAVVATKGDFKEKAEAQKALDALSKGS